MVFPVPGPPVKIMTLECIADVIASAWTESYCMSVRFPISSRSTFPLTATEAGALAILISLFAVPVSA